MNPFLKAFFPAVAFFLAATPSAHAQLGLYGQFSTSSNTIVNTPRLYGGAAGVFYDSKHFPVAHLGVDVRGSFQRATRNNIETSITSVSAGPRIAFHLPIIHPYGEVLVGGGHVGAGQGLAVYDRSGFSASAIAGADLHLLPFIDWRVIDYSFTRVPHTDQHSISTGIVVRIPFS